MATAIEITDVVLRDGLQDEPVITTVEDRVIIAEALRNAGVRSLEVAAFVNPARVPQMSGADELLARLPRDPNATFSAIALNRKGVVRAHAAGARRVEIVVSASEAHSRENAGRTRTDALTDFAGVVTEFPDITFVAAVATAFECPFEGDIPVQRLLEVVGRFVEMGVTEIQLADTIGTASPEKVVDSLDAVMTAHPTVTIGLHLHNKYGQALRTVDAAIARGVTRFDAAAGGYGGCPFAPGAPGNLATEDLVRHLHAAAHPTGIDESRLDAAVALVHSVVSRSTPVT